MEVSYFEEKVDVWIENNIKLNLRRNKMAELRTDFMDTEKLSVGDPKWNEAWTHNRKIKRINKGICLQKFGLFLLDRGYTHITMEYEGCGDSGDSYCAEGFKSKAEFDKRGDKWGVGERIAGWGEDVDKGTHNQKELIELFKTYQDHNPDADFGRDSEDLSYVLSSIINYDWYNNEGGSGELIWDIKKESILVDGYQNYTGQYECKETYSLNGKEPKYKYRDQGH